MSHKEFEQEVIRAIGELPERARKNMDNVAVCIEDYPSDFQLKETGTRMRDLLLGLYEGVPRDEWGKGFGMQLPDKITIFQQPIESLSRTNEEIRELIEGTVWHEIAHHFGYDEDEVSVLEAKWDRLFRERKRL
jgi:predicted Zn-dependent protease with MMP-like domain